MCSAPTIAPLPWQAEPVHSNSDSSHQTETARRANAANEAFSITSGLCLPEVGRMCHYNFDSISASTEAACEAACEATDGCNQFSMHASYGCRIAKDSKGCCEDVHGADISQFCTANSGWSTVNCGVGGQDCKMFSCFSTPSPTPTTPACSDSDSCIAAKDGWDGWTCTRGAQRCTSRNAAWARDMNECCPVTCSSCSTNAPVPAAPTAAASTTTAPNWANRRGSTLAPPLNTPLMPTAEGHKLLNTVPTTQPTAAQPDAARRTCVRSLLIGCSSGHCEDPNAQCVGGWTPLCECAEPLCCQWSVHYNSPHHCTHYNTHKSTHCSSPPRPNRP